MMNNTAVKPRKPKKEKIKRSKLRSNEGRYGYFFLAPWMIGFLFFFLYPMLYSLILSFSRVIDIKSYTLIFNGFKNFETAFFSDTEFVPALLESTKNMLIKTPVVVIFSLFIAILLNRNLKFKGVFRVAFFLPVLLGTGVVLSTINGSIGSEASEAAQLAAQTAAQETAAGGSGMSEETGALVTLLGPQIAYYLELILEVVTDVLWMSGIQIVIFLGALQNIPSSYYEAAYCDGASEWEKFWKITLPLTMPNILLVTVYTMIDYLSNSENEVVVYCNKVGLEGNANIALGSAMAWIHFLVSGVLILLVFLILKRFTYYADE